MLRVLVPDLSRFLHSAKIALVESPSKEHSICANRGAAMVGQLESSTAGIGVPRAKKS